MKPRVPPRGRPFPTCPSFCFPPAGNPLKSDRIRLKILLYFRRNQRPDHETETTINSEDSPSQDCRGIRAEAAFQAPRPGPRQAGCLDFRSRRGGQDNACRQLSRQPEAPLPVVSGGRGRLGHRDVLLLPGPGDKESRAAHQTSLPFLLPSTSSAFPPSPGASSRTSTAG